MFKYFFTYIDNIPKNMYRELFDRQQLLALLIVACAGIILTLIFKDKMQEKKWRFITLLSLMLPILEIAQMVWYKRVGQFSLGYTLPLHLCSLMCIILPIMTLTQSRFLQEYAYSMGLAPALLALLTPDVYYYPAVSFIYIQTMIVHGIICFIPIFMMLGMGFRPNIRILPKTIAMLIGLALIITPINILTDGNYFFLRYPAPGSPMEAFANIFGSPGYLIPTFILGCALWGLMYLPFVIYAQRHRNAKNIKKDEEKILVSSHK